jgi:hypothetical protein
VARASTPPANIIVHVEETGLQSDGTRVGAEWWQETSPPYAMRLIKTHGGAPRDESATDGTTASQYDPGTNTIYRHPDPTPPTLIDPIESDRAALTDGTARVAGTVTIDGRPLYEIDLPGGVVGYFDQTDYRPVYIDNPQRDGTIVRTEVVTYEELSINPEHEQLLSIAAQHHDASVESGTAPAPAGQK